MAQRLFSHLMFFRRIRHKTILQMILCLLNHRILIIILFHLRTRNNHLLMYFEPQSDRGEGTLREGQFYPEPPNTSFKIRPDYDVTKRVVLLW